ncbi:unnamed protein product, partial [Phaeothamnion confervicola]
ISRFTDFFEADDVYHLVMELVEGGELFDRVVARQNYSELEARECIRGMLAAIAYCHNVGVVHRDIKPENVLLASQDNDHDIKLADFGLAQAVSSSAVLLMQCGTPSYVAPEILKAQPYGKAVDVWSVGVVSFILLCGYPPFYASQTDQLYAKIKRGKVRFDDVVWDSVSADAKDLLRGMMTVEPDDRLTAEKALCHRWFVDHDATELQLRDLGGALRQMRLFHARRKFKAAIRSAIIVRRL